MIPDIFVDVDNNKPEIKLISAPFSDKQEVCYDSDITNIVYGLTNASDAYVTGLPAGLSGSISVLGYVISGSSTLPGSYTYTVTTNGSCGVASATGIINVNPVITLPHLVSGSPTTLICPGNAVFIEETKPVGGNDSYTYEWKSSSDNGVSYSNASLINSTLNYVSDQLYADTYFQLTVTSGSCTTQSDEHIVIVEKLPIATITSANITICSNEPYTLPSIATASTILNGATITWSTNGAGTITSVSSTSGSSTLTPTYTPVVADAGKNITVLLTLTTNLSCGIMTDTASFVISVKSLPIAKIVGESSHLCPADSIVLKGSALNGLITWSSTGLGTIINGTNDTITYKPSLLDAGSTVVLTMKVESCATVSSANYSVVVYQLPVAPVNAGVDDTISLGRSIQLNAKGSSIVTWNWSPATSLDDQYISSPVASPLETTKYAIEAIHLNGCISRDTINIIVLKDYELIISNLLTPNGDGKNDTWGIQNIENYPGTEVIIVNRNGEVVFEESNYSNNWDGKFNGKELPDATYYYVLKFATSDKIYKGAVTLLHQ